MLKKITLAVALTVFGAVGYAGAAPAHPVKAKTIAPIVPQGLCPSHMCVRE